MNFRFWTLYFLCLVFFFNSNCANPFREVHSRIVSARLDLGKDMDFLFEKGCTKLLCIFQNKNEWKQLFLNISPCTLGILKLIGGVRMQSMRLRWKGFSETWREFLRGAELFRHLVSTYDVATWRSTTCSSWLISHVTSLWQDWPLPEPLK